jgi:hypothetical protein
MALGERWSTATSQAQTPQGREPRSQMAPKGDVISAETTCAIRVASSVVEADAQVALRSRCRAPRCAISVGIRF